MSCEAYYTEDELVDGLCPVHHTPVERVTEENYFFQLSRFEDRLLAHYADASRGGAAESRATRCSASSSRASATSR